MSKFKDYFSKQSADYSRFRPSYPKELYPWLASLCKGNSLAWDVGTGNGQAALGLTSCFDKILATDPSNSQINHAVHHPRIEYRVAPAEYTPLDEASVDLITVAQAVHWFDFTAFYKEVRRVGKPGSILAVWTYLLNDIENRIDKIVRHYYHDIVGKYWPPERKLVEERYQTIPFPFKEINPPEFRIYKEWTRDDLIGFFATWSATQKYIAATGNDPVEQILPDLEEAWREPASHKEVSWELILRVGEISQPNF